MTTILTRILLVIVTGIAISGGAYAQRSLDGNRRAWTECQARQNASSAFLALSHKIGSRASPDVAFSTQKATPEEARNLQILLRDYIIPCRQFSLEVARARLPAIVPILKASQVEEDASYERLIAGEITWGQFIRDMKVSDAEFDAELRRHESAAGADEPQTVPAGK